MDTIIAALILLTLVLALVAFATMGLTLRRPLSRAFAWIVFGVYFGVFATGISPALLTSNGRAYPMGNLMLTFTAIVLMGVAAVTDNLWIMAAGGVLLLIRLVRCYL